MKRNTLAGIVLAIPFIIGILAVGAVAQVDRPVKKAIVFFSPSCHSCIDVKEKFLPGVEKEFARSVIFEYRDLSEIENYRLLGSLRSTYGKPHTFTVPLVFFEGAFLEGKPEVESGLRPLLEAATRMGTGHVGATPAPTPAIVGTGQDLVEKFKSFTPAAVVSAGLIDGINPCAFTVIVFFMSFLALQGYRRREVVSIGLGFIAAVFATYLLIGLGLFNFLYRLKGFWQVTAGINFVVGTLSVLFALYCVNDIYRFRKTGLAESMSLQLPAAVKRRIHDVIGFFYRRDRVLPGTTGVSRPHPALLFGTALVTGFLVSVLEAVCTGQVYLPTIVFVMKTTEFKARAWQLLVLYNLMFIVPLCAVFVLAVFGTRSAQFAAFFRRRVVAVKALLAVVFFAMGLMLLVRVG